MQHTLTRFGTAGRKAIASILAAFLVPGISFAAGAPPLWQTELITLISHQRYQEAGETLESYCVDRHNAELCLMLASAYFEGEAQLGVERKDVIEAYRYTKLACDHGSAAGCNAYKAAIEKGELLQYVLFEPGVDNRDEQLKEAIALGADLNATTMLTATVLQKAVSEENRKAVRLLLENGADVNYRVSEDDPTPLMYAINNGNPEIVAMLLDSGADISQKMQVPADLNMGSGSIDACGFADKLQQGEIAELLQCGRSTTAVD